MDFKNMIKNMTSEEFDAFWQRFKPITVNYTDEKDKEILKDYDLHTVGKSEVIVIPDGNIKELWYLLHRLQKEVKLRSYDGELIMDIND